MANYCRAVTKSPRGTASIVETGDDYSLTLLNLWCISKFSKKFEKIKTQLSGPKRVLIQEIQFFSLSCPFKRSSGDILDLITSFLLSTVSLSGQQQNILFIVAHLLIWRVGQSNSILLPTFWYGEGASPTQSRDTVACLESAHERWPRVAKSNAANPNFLFQIKAHIIDQDILLI